MKPITNIRKAVAILANRINRKIQNLSSAFTRAWQVVKGRQLILSKVAGVTFGTRQKALAKLAGINPTQISAELIRESDNQYDANAVGVHIAVNGSQTYQIGYLPRDIAAVIAAVMDKGIKLQTTFKGVTGGTADRFNYGALVGITL